MDDNNNKVIAIDVKTHLKMAMPICEIEGFAKGCEIAFPEASKAFKEIGGKAHALLEAWYALEENTDDKELRFDNPPQSLRVKIDTLTKERDELKAKLEAGQSTNANIGIAYAMNWKNKLEEADRCISDCETALDNIKTLHAKVDADEILNIIRAYLEKEEK